MQTFWDVIVSWSAKEMRKALRDPEYGKIIRDVIDHRNHKRKNIKSVAKTVTPTVSNIYVIGSLRNRKKIMALSQRLRRKGFEVFDDWASAFEDADQILYRYYKSRGFNYAQMVNSPAARNIFNFDYEHLCEADMVVLVAPFGKAACLEAGWSIGAEKPVFMLLDKEPKRADLMMGFLTKIVYTEKELFKALSNYDLESEGM